MQFRILGPVEIEVNGNVIAPSRRQERCLLGVLLLEANRVVSVDRLAELLWDGEQPKRVRGAVQGYVSRVRAVLSRTTGDHGVELVYSGGGYKLVVAPEFVDAHRFRTLLAGATRVNDLAERAAQLRAALALWRGRALADAVSGWARDGLCSQLEEQRLVATEEYVLASLSLGQEREVLPELARMVSDNPGREKLIELHMRALYQVGRKVEALDVYGRARAYLADEFGVDPGPVLRDLHQAILRDELEVPTAVEPPLAPGSPVHRPRQLPADIAGFTGRVEYLRQLDGLLGKSGDPAKSVVISAIGGTAGVGKTALAVHWAHRVADRFPEGQLYLNLRGFDPGGSPMEPADAVRALLDGFEVPQRRIPTGLDAQVGLYRSVLADRRVLVILDNARDVSQIRPLLPASPGCLALVTSRNQLSSLAVREGARTLELDLLSPPEARELLEGRLGAETMAADPEGVDEIISRCAGLPLALAIVAARIASGSASLRSLIAELREAGQLDALGSPDPTVDLRAVFSSSYHALSESAARLFRLLGLHPGPDFSVAAAASLAGTALRDTRRLLDDLVQASLVVENSPARYSLHDLLLTYAAEVTNAVDSPKDRQAARRRVFDYYLHTAVSGIPVLSPNRLKISSPAAAPGAQVDTLTSIEHALAWFSAERRVLRSAVAKAADAGFNVHSWQLAWASMYYYDHLGLWRDQIATQLIAVEAARRAGDRVGQANAYFMLGSGYTRLRRFDEAKLHLARAVEIFAEIGDHAGQAVAHTNLAMLSSENGEYTDGVRHAQQALTLYRLGGQHHREGGALNNLGVAYAMAGEYQQSLTFCQKALTLYQQSQSMHGQAAAWDSVGYAHHHLGNHQQALECYGRAVELYRETGDPFNEADVLSHLGDTRRAVGDVSGARDAWRQAEGILQQLDHPDAIGLRTKIEQLGVAGSS